MQVGERDVLHAGFVGTPDGGAGEAEDTVRACRVSIIHAQAGSAGKPGRNGAMEKTRRCGRGTHRAIVVQEAVPITRIAPILGSPGEGRAPSGRVRFGRAFGNSGQPGSSRQLDVRTCDGRVERLAGFARLRTRAAQQKDGPLSARPPAHAGIDANTARPGGRAVPPIQPIVRPGCRRCSGRQTPA